MNKFKRPVSNDKEETTNENQESPVNEDKVEEMVNKAEEKEEAKEEVLEAVMNEASEEEKEEKAEEKQEEYHVNEVNVQTVEDISDASLAVVRQHAFLSSGAGFIPIPMVDIAAVSLNQMVMVKRLSSIYDVPFMKDAFKTILAVFVFDLGSGTATRIGASLLKSIPVIGSVAGAVSLSAYSGAFTYALGQVFRQHFEAGGTFLDMNPNKLKAYFKDQYEEGKKISE